MQYREETREMAALVRQKGDAEGMGRCAKAESAVGMPTFQPALSSHAS
jgi:hypothetical protein